MNQNDENYLPVVSKSQTQNKIRVMHGISSWAMGGTEKMLTHLIPHFDKTRFESCLMCFNSPSKVSEEWMAAGVPVFHLNMDKRVSGTGVYRLVKLLKAWKPDILMVYGLRANLMARVAAWWCRVPVFITGQRGIEDWKTKKEVFLEKVTSCFVDLYIGNSNACCQMLAKREKISPKKLHTIPNGIAFDIPPDIDEKTAAMAAHFQLPKNKLMVGSVGRLQPVKGHHDLIAAMPAVLEKHPDTFFVVVGEDHRNGQLQQLAQRLGVERSICFAGYSRDIAAWLNCFDIFVLPSLSEGMPVAAIEAMFMGKPVIATDVGGVPEVVLDGQTGLLVPPSSPEQIAKSIITLIENPDLRKKYAAAGNERAISHFTAKIMIQRYEDIFLDLLSRKKKHL